MTLTNVTACLVGEILDLDNTTRENVTITDQVAPYLTSFYPAIHIANVTGSGSYIPVTIDNITVTFSESMDTSSITTNTADTSCSGTFQLSKCGNGGANCDNAFLSSNSVPCVQMSAAPVASNDNKTFTIDPNASLAPEKVRHYIKVTTGAKDTSGNALNDGSSDNTSAFQTAD